MNKMKECAGLLKGWDNILVLSHASPDGDTLGSAAALLRALELMGKKTAFRCGDPVHKKYNYLFEGLELACPYEEAEYVITVDVADPALLGKLRGEYENKIDMAIDHHGTHVPFGKTEWVEGEAAANCQLIYKLLLEMGVEVDRKMADCLYTGISTDTGCFKYSNATGETHRIAADLIDLGADSAEINRVMFDTKTRAALEAERLVMNDIEFYAEGKIALIAQSKDILERTGAEESDLEALPAMARSIEGVILGLTFKEKEGGVWKASVRATLPADASAICRKFGGGGHRGAAGCSFECELSEAKKLLVAECERYLEEMSL